MTRDIDEVHCTTYKNSEERTSIIEFDSVIEETVENLHIPGLQIGLILDGKVVLSGLVA